MSRVIKIHTLLIILIYLFKLKLLVIPVRLLCLHGNEGREKLLVKETPKARWNFRSDTMWMGRVTAFDITFLAQICCCKVCNKTVGFFEKEEEIILEHWGEILFKTGKWHVVEISEWLGN